jgi:hypothetical protein
MSVLQSKSWSFYAETVKKRESRGHIHNTLFSLKLTNGHNKLECYVTLERKASPGTNAITYMSHSHVTKKMKSCEYGP